MQPSCDPAAVVPISAATGVGLDRLLRQIAESPIPAEPAAVLYRNYFSGSRIRSNLGYFSAEELTTLLTRYPTDCCLAPVHTLLAPDANPRTWTTRSYHEIRARATILVCGQRRAEHTE